MPLKKAKGKSKKAKQKVASENISEFHKGGTYKKTEKKFGKATADAQAVAAGMHAAGIPPKGGKHRRGPPAGMHTTTSDRR